MIEEDYLIMALIRTVCAVIVCVGSIIYWRHRWDIGSVIK